MALSKEEIELAKTIGASFLGGFGGRVGALRGVVGQGGRPWRTITRTDREGFTPVDDNVRNVRAAEMLAEQMVEEPIDFNAGIIYVPGPAQNNAMYVHSPDNDKSFIRQTKEDHEYALSKYMDDPNIPKDRAVQLGIKTEQNLPKWWNDHDPRLPVTPSSSCVSSARIGPDGDIYIRFREGGKEYQYEGSPDPVKASEILAKLVTSDSIGRNVNSWTGDWGRVHTYLPKG